MSVSLAVACAVLALVVGLLVEAGGHASHGADAGRRAAYLRVSAVARAEIAEARALRSLWLGTDQLASRAAHAAADGNFETAIGLAARARREARLARNQARLEATRYAVDLQRAALAPASLARLDALIVAHDGPAAFALARRLGVVMPE